ncbi:MAG: hypothetical protein A3G34_15085 [Candidatus Lindowbacteria bacterium RIFCSPLOWO2_12_FULL_62_27]|nr:MAG: hypothetical protein A3G34_15085 [Candidatus Lindowbacteria bacterium RIFCSPLOWO2_12_FULL_62_27]OGH63851.1 MAG: hypothetical protein A3I06_06065 [Candidatus Lindowbacteria bacterium RIFCSPLOWO2_02_FULL_62_12]
MLVALVGRKGSGKTMVARYLAQKHKFHVLDAAQALKRDTRQGFHLVDGLSSRRADLDKLIDQGAAVWLVRRPGEPDTFRGRKITIVVENPSTLRELQTAVEQKLWGCC